MLGRAFVLLWFSLTSSQAVLSIHANDLGGMEAGSLALESFEVAASFWEREFDDEVVVELDVSFVPMSGSVLGMAGIEWQTVDFTDWKEALTSDASTDADSLMVENLPVGETFQPYMNRTRDNPNGVGSATPYVDDDGGANNRFLRVPKANAKALGLAVSPASGADGSISINSSLKFDYDSSDGIDALKYGLTDIFVHEIGHTLGFVSGVDFFEASTVLSLSDDDQLDYVTGLDFTRFSTASQSADADFDWTADSRPKYFSIDGGASALTGTSLAIGDWSTGATFGDGFQNSHWKHRSGHGSLEPTLSRGNAFVISSTDVLALDVIGWTPRGQAVPEPNFTLVGLLLLVGGLRVRSRMA